MRTTALAAFAAGAVALGTCATTGAPPRAQGFPVWERTLPSGMQVVVEQDATASVAGVVLVVDTGSADDPPGKPGMAHTLEHLVFRVPDDTGISMATRLVRRAAASYNATTGLERTTYFAFAPSRSLDDLVAIVLARIADPLRGASDALLAREAAIVADELRIKEGRSGTEVLMPALLAAARRASARARLRGPGPDGAAVTGRCARVRRAVLPA
jgi:zinc protease